MTRLLVNLPALLILGVCAFPQAAQAQVHFESDVQPLLEKHCLSCHSAEESNGGLNFEGLSTVFQEADSGKHAIVPGKPAESELLSRVVSNDEDVRMPPDGPRLSEDEIGLLRDWIELGANIPQEWMDTADTQVLSDHWAFQPILCPPLPQVAKQAWCRSPIDYFVAAELESQELTFAEDASPEVLIRRACYDLTGLPPSMERVRHFQSRVAVLGDQQLAFAELVDELLAQSEYGERWGRHWMDWVRYADTAGCNSDFPIPQAYLYRNYIIDSLNEDMPYDRFLTEQLAGDLLPAESQTERNRLNIATGYLAMARRFGSLVETYPWHLTIEDTIDNMGRTMLGMTLACARCHDHKFDPVSTRDYYGLYGIFASTKYAFPGIELFQVQHEMVPLVSEQELEHLLGEEAPKTEKLVDNLRAELEKCRKRELENAARESSLTLAEKRQQYDELQSMLGKARNAGSALAKHLKELPAVPVAYAVQDGQPQAARIHIKGEPTRLGAEVPRGFPKVLGGYRLQETSTSGRLELAQWITHQDNPLTARVIVNRVWQRHFGRGLVASTSDFGIRGELPSHPALLDWLADDFKKHGWSLKHLHRRILNSRTYQLSSRSHDSVASVSNQEVDPENRLLWRFNRQRLDAEAIRDTLLVLSGRLDPSPQTEPYPIPPQKDWKYTQHHPFKDDYEDHKRSVYQMTKRLTVEAYMQTFDGADPNVCTSRRDESVTALQALYFVNDEFLHEQARYLAVRLVRQCEAETERAHALFSEVVCREPSHGEVHAVLAHTQKVQEKLENSGQEDAEEAAWASAVRALFRLNEFVYID